MFDRLFVCTYCGYQEILTPDESPSDCAQCGSVMEEDKEFQELLMDKLDERHLRRSARKDEWL